MNNKQRAPRNRTITINNEELAGLRNKLLQIHRPVSIKAITNKTIHQDLYEVIDFLPKNSVDLLFVDPPYNLDKSFNGLTFKQVPIDAYCEYIDQWLGKLTLLLKPNAVVYICGDWRSSTSIHLVGGKYLEVFNRITWEREKGRGAKRNWKNCTEDIWFFARSRNYTFNLDAVKMKRKVLAPYKNNGRPKDWEETSEGNFRLTHPSNIWNDITIPYWSMPENTDHPTQKPEKLLAKLILASTNPGDVVLDPFLGSGTTSVVAKKLNRNYIGIEADEYYACLAEKRLNEAVNNKTIQGYKDGIFWERNSYSEQHNGRKVAKKSGQPDLL